MSKRKRKSEKKSSSQSCWFLDTSVFINRLFGHPLLKKDIEQTINTIPCYTSFFVSYEFKRSAIKDLIECYYVVKEEGPVDALYTIKESFQQRKKSIILGVLSSELAREDISSNKLKALSRLEALVGISNMEQLEQAVAYANKGSLPVEVFDRLNEVWAITKWRFQ